jgi:hypothetical protein
MMARTLFKRQVFSDQEMPAALRLAGILYFVYDGIF